MENLVAYLNDHRAGARFAIDLLERLRDSQHDESLSEFASGLLPEIEADLSVVESLVERLDSKPSKLKESAGWLAEKLSRLKLGYSNNPSLGTFESLETLALGIQGKLKLWQILSDLSREINCLNGVDYPSLVHRAESQHERVESRRRSAARHALVDAAE